MRALPLDRIRAPLRTFRPRDLEHLYAQPTVQVGRLVEHGRVRRAAHGYYYAIPDDQPLTWRPSIEAVAAGIASAAYGERVPVMMHLSAARLHGAAPRALSLAMVAVPARRSDDLHLTDRERGRVILVMRDVQRLDAVLMATDLGRVLTTSIEQTALDLARRRDLGGQRAEAMAAAVALSRLADPAVLDDLAGRQRMRATLERLVIWRETDDARPPT